MLLMIYVTEQSFNDQEQSCLLAYYTEMSLRIDSSLLTMQYPWEQNKQKDRIQRTKIDEQEKKCFLTCLHDGLQSQCACVCV